MPFTKVYLAKICKKKIRFFGCQMPLASPSFQWSLVSWPTWTVAWSKGKPTMAGNGLYP